MNPGSFSPRCIRTAIRVAPLLGLLTLPSLSLGSTVVQDSDAVGVLDTATGLEWLPLSVTNTLNYNQAVANPVSSIPAGYVLATDAQVVTLLQDFGFTSVPPNNTFTVNDGGAIANAFLSLFGTTDAVNNLSAGYSKPPNFSISTCGAGCLAATFSTSAVYGPSANTFNHSGSAVLFNPDGAGVNVSFATGNGFFLVKNAAPLGVAVLDPVPTLLFGNQITSTRINLASNGRVVQGVAADGISEVVLRIPVIHLGDKVTATLLSDRCTDLSNPSTCAASASSDEDGGLFNAGAAVTSSQSLPNSVSDTAQAPVTEAFVAYRAPIDFARTSADANVPSRMVYIDLAYSSGGVPYGSQIVPLTILRPPVILVHGYSAGPEAWDQFQPLVPLPGHNSQFSLFPVNYGWPLYTATVNPNGSLTYNISGKVGYDIQSTTPAMNMDAIHQLRESDLGFSWNAPDVHEQILSWISNFTVGGNTLGVPVAGVSADVVAHSMGGLVVRYLTTFPGFLSDSPYSQGYIHKLITIGTPHFGTPAAILSVLPNTSCTRSVLAAHNNINITGATSTTSVFLPGAAGEMEGDGIGLGMSNALTTIKSKSIPIPTVTLAGDVTSLELNVNNAPISQLLNACGIDYNDPLGTRFTSSGFESIFDPDITPSNPLGGAGGRKSDGVVPLTSALMNPLATACNSNQCFAGYTHSEGPRAFFGTLFNPFGSNVPYLQDSSLKVSEQVEQLLNTSISNQVFWGQ